MEENQFVILHDEFGEEIFEIVDAEYNLYQTESGIWEFVIAFNTKEAIKRAKELEEVIEAEPTFEASLILSIDETEIFEGQIMKQFKGYDEQREENLSNIYYFAHESIENMEFRIITIQKDWIIAEVKGEAIINNYASGKPDAKLSTTTTKFFLNKQLERSFS